MNTHPIAAEYVRTSQDKDDAFSLSSQLREIRQYAKDNGITISYTFQDEYTGKVLDRAGLNELRKLLRDGVINTVIVFDATRLARKVGVAEYILDEVFEYGIELHLVSWGTFVKNTPRDIKTFYDEAVYAHIERMKIVERLSRGKVDKLSQGQWLCQGIDKYGFTTVGTKRNQHLEIVKDEADIIAGIYALFLQGKRVVDITEELQTAGYDTPSKAKGFWKPKEQWTPTMVYKILRDEAYTGVFYANKWHQIKNDNGKHSTIKNDRDQWIRLYFPDLRIVSDEDFATVQQLLDTGRSRFAPNPTNDYLMNRRIKCADCGMGVTASTTVVRGNKYSYYTCNSGKAGRANARDDKHALRVRCRAVDDIVYNFVVDLLNDPESVLKELQHKQREQLECNAVAVDNVNTARRVLDRYEDELKGYAELYAQKLIPISIFVEKKADLDKRISAAKDIVAEYESSVSKRILTDADIRHKAKEIRNLKESLDKERELTYDRLKAAIELFDIKAAIGCRNNRVYCGIAWYGQTTAYWCDNQDVFTRVAMNSTFDSLTKIHSSTYCSGIWEYVIG